MSIGLDIKIEAKNTELEKLALRTGRSVTYQNGQQVYGPPIGETFVPRKGSEVFVGKLPRDCKLNEVIMIFERVGRIFDLRLMMDFSGTNRGYCFVRYYTPREAAMAVMELNHFRIRRGRDIGVTKSVDNCRIFVGGIPNFATKDQVLDEVRKLTDNIVHVMFKSRPASKDKGNHTGFAIIEYNTHGDAAAARGKLPGRLQVLGVNVAVDWAEPKFELNALYVRNLHTETKVNIIFEIFSKATLGGVEFVRKQHRVTLIRFITHEDARVAKELLNFTEIEGATIQIVWARETPIKPIKIRPSSYYRYISKF